jgi:hypothetical protein
MNHTLKRTAVILTLIAGSRAIAAEDHDHGHHHDHHQAGKDHHGHDESVTKGPNRGQVVRSKAGFAFEIVVDKDRKARLVFIDKDHKAVALGEQLVSGIAGERSAPVKLVFARGKEKDADVLISDKALPKGDHVQMILTIKTAPDAKPVTERFELHLH